MEEEPRYPRVGQRAGHYESYYLKAARPGGGQAVWIRYTVHKPPGRRPNAAIWFTLFDRKASGPLAFKETFSGSELSQPSDGWLRISGSQIGPGEASGSVAARSVQAGWDLRFDMSGEPCRYLPAIAYRTPLPKTKFVAPVPNTRISGKLTLDGDEFEISEWPGMVGHNWGSEHAERWVWLEGTGFDDDPDAYFDTGAARIKVGERVLPWLAAGKLRVEGETHDLGGPTRFRATRIDASPGRCEFILPGRTAKVRGRLTADIADFVGWEYADPDGPGHETINCSVSDLELTVIRPGRPERTLRLPGAGAFELGMRERDHGVPIQPFPDG